MTPTVKRWLAASAAAILMAFGLVAVTALPASATPTCGDTSGGWVPSITGSVWDVELFLYGTEDLTAVATFTYSGQVAVTVVGDDVQLLTGQYDFAGGTPGTFVWSATDVLDNGYRLTLSATANDCGLLGGVHAAYGSVNHQTQGNIGSLYMTRVT